jgi:Ni2+-binding GTPase involved in maturation of urease and hydrogenase
MKFRDLKMIKIGVFGPPLSGKTKLSNAIAS